MKRTTYIKLIITIIALIAGVWYFAKDYNYRISFTGKQAPGVIYTNLLQWNSWKDHNTGAVTTLSKTPFSRIRQEVTIADSVFTYRWVVKRKNDSVTKITAYIKDRNNSFLQNLQVPFYKNAFVKRSITTVEKIRDRLKQHGTYYNVSPVKKSSIPATYCAYIVLESALRNKADAMIKNISTVMSYLKDNNIPLTGDPFLEITGWNIREDSITFNFCFPVEEKNDYPRSEAIKFKKTEARSALKVTFNGNYKISDNAWYTLIDYARAHDIAIENLPVEIYLNDPHGGGDELQWQAEVYMPVKN